MKRSKNIFNSMIAPQNLLQSEGVRQNKVGELTINSNWLKGVRLQQYRPYLISALKRSELQKQIDDLKEDQVSSPTKQSNLFKMGKTKKKMDQPSLQPTDDSKPLEQYLAQNEPPETEDLIIQKMSQGFFKSLLERKCKISDKELYIETLKDQNKKWLKLGIVGYTLQLQEKQKPLDKPQFAEFKWINGYNQRILLWEPSKKPYCLYGKLDHLKKFQRYFQVQNIQVKQLNVFKSLEAQLKQKIVVYFGKKVRFYDYSIRIRKNQKDAQLDTYQDQKIPQAKMRQQKQKEDKERQKSIGQSSQMGLSSDFSQSGLLQSQLHNLPKSNDKGSNSVTLQLEASKSDKKQKNPQTKQRQKTNDGEKFKLKLKSSIIFYNEIKEPLEFNDQQFKIQDLKLNLRDQIGISDVDEESQSRSGASVRENKENSRKKITRMTVRNLLDNQQKYSINIYEASSQQKANSTQKQQNQFDLQIPALARKNTENFSQYIKSSSIQTPKGKGSLKLNPSQFGNIHDLYKSKQHKQLIQNQLIGYFQLQKARPPQQSLSSDKDSFRRSFTPINQLERQIRKANSIKKIGQVDVFQSSNLQEVYFTVAFIDMLVPYHSEKLDFQILQINPDLQMQGKIVTCGRVKECLNQKRLDGQRYMHYSAQGGLHFMFAKASDKFMFVLVQQTKCHYIPFEIDTNLKYKKNCSQLLISQLDQQGYPFAACLGLYVSSNEIVLNPILKTVQFMQKYLNEGQSYDFKHDFINDKKRLQFIKKQWNKKVAKNSLRLGDSQAFGKAVFLGLSQSIFKSLKKKANYDPNKLFNFTDNQYRLIEQNITLGLMELKSFLKPLYLVKLVAESMYNDFMKQRLQQTYVYFMIRYGSVRNLALVFIKQILEKLEPILLSCRREQDVASVLKLYFQVQYQIDELFLKISSYFKK